METELWTEWLRPPCSWLQKPQSARTHLRLFWPHITSWVYKIRQIPCKYPNFVCSTLHSSSGCNAETHWCMTAATQPADQQLNMVLRYDMIWHCNIANNCMSATQSYQLSHCNLTATSAKGWSSSKRQKMMAVAGYSSITGIAIRPQLSPAMT